MGLGSRKQPTTAAPPLKDLIYRLVANLVVLLVSGTTFLALLLQKLKVQGGFWVWRFFVGWFVCLGFYVLFCFLWAVGFGFFCFGFVFLLVFFPSFLMGRRDISLYRNVRVKNSHPAPDSTLLYIALLPPHHLSVEINALILFAG